MVNGTQQGGLLYRRLTYEAVCDLSFGSDQNTAVKLAIVGQSQVPWALNLDSAGTKGTFSSQMPDKEHLNLCMAHHIQNIDLIKNPFF
jgi:hypothetical protein